MKYLRRHFGVEGEETSLEISESDLQFVKLVAFHVNKSASNTPWESKCLVRALTAQKILSSNKIACTLYLGVSHKDKQMIAHSWLRAGIYYVTGGNGADYTIVEMYRN